MAWGRPHKIGFAAALLAFVGSMGWTGWQYFDALPAGLKKEYVGREKCVDCHPKQLHAWTGSHHDRAMEEVGSESVLGDFTDAAVQHRLGASRFYRKDGQYLVDTPGRDGKAETFPIKYTFGVEPLQQYLIEFPNGRMQCLPIAWDTNKKEWIHLYEEVEPHEWIYWTNGGMTWNHVCADCHSTNLVRNYDPDADKYHTTWSEIDVSCEACHGPASLHLEIVKKGKWFWDRRYGTGLARLKGKENTDTMIDACGRCHARRQVVTDGFEPGKRFIDHYHPELLDTDAYHPDGQIRDEDYEYGSFHLSLMRHKGVRCTDCHDPHTAKLQREGNALCTKCHQPGKYDAPSHHKHDPAGKGARCVECHMPETVYMKVDPRRDHSFRIPRPQLTDKQGVPNACNRCHQDKDVPWAIEHWEKWYGKEKKFERRINFSDAIADGRQAKPEAVQGLLALARDPKLPAVLRASAGSLLRNYPPDKTLPLLDSLWSDREPIMPLTLLRRFEPEYLFPGWQPGREYDPIGDVKRRVESIAGLLDHDSGSVRTEAARLLASLPRNVLPTKFEKKFDHELKECLHNLRLQSDTPDANLNLGNLYQLLGEEEPAERWYRAALDRYPGFIAARFNLGMLLYQLGKREDAAEQFQQVVQWTGRDASASDAELARASKRFLAQAHYQLGLLEAENPASLAQAVEHLRRAVAIEPDRHRARYNLGLAYQQLGRHADAEEQLQAAYKADENSDEYAYALANFYASRRQIELAKRLAQRALTLNPNRQDAMGLLRRLEQESK